MGNKAKSECVCLKHGLLDKNSFYDVLMMLFSDVNMSLINRTHTHTQYWRWMDDEISPLEKIDSMWNYIS